MKKLFSVTMAHKLMIHAATKLKRYVTFHKSGNYRWNQLLSLFSTLVDKCSPVSEVKKQPTIINKSGREQKQLIRYNWYGKTVFGLYKHPQGVVTSDYATVTPFHATNFMTPSSPVK